MKVRNIIPYLSEFDPLVIKQVPEFEDEISKTIYAGSCTEVPSEIQDKQLANECGICIFTLREKNVTSPAIALYVR